MALTWTTSSSVNHDERQDAKDQDHPVANKSIYKYWVSKQEPQHRSKRYPELAHEVIHMKTGPLFVEDSLDSAQSEEAITNMSMHLEH